VSEGGGGTLLQATVIDLSNTAMISLIGLISLQCRLLLLVQVVSRRTNEQQFI